MKRILTLILLLVMVGSVSAIDGDEFIIDNPSYFIAPIMRLIDRSLYVRWETENTLSDIRFSHKYGSLGTGADSNYFVVNPDDTPGACDTVLYNLKYLSPSKYINPDLSDQAVNYYAALGIWVDTADIEDGDVLGYLIIDFCHADSTLKYVLYADSITQNIYEYEFGPYMSVNRKYDGYIEYSVAITDTARIKIDYLKVYNCNGLDLVEGCYYDENIINYIHMKRDLLLSYYQTYIMYEQSPAHSGAGRYFGELMRKALR